MAYIVVFSSLKRKYNQRVNLYQGDIWPPFFKHRRGKIIRLNLVNKCQAREIKRTPIKCSDIFKGSTTKQSIAKVLLEGSPGIGKTTLCTQISSDWAQGKLFQEFKLLLFLPLRCTRVTSAASFAELIQIASGDENLNVCESMATSLKGEKILLILDGWDELDKCSLAKESLLYNLIFESSPSISVILTSRPLSHLAFPPVDRHIEVLGFSKKDIQEYILSEFSSDQESPSHLFERLTVNPALMSMCSIPLNCAIICEILRESFEESLPSTMTKLYSRFVVLALQRNYDKCTSIRLKGKGLPHEEFHLLCKLAYDGVESSKVIFSQWDIDSCFPKGVSSAGAVLTECYNSYSFLHVSLQELLAAIYLKLQPKEKIFDFFDKFKYKDSMVLKFFVGVETKSFGYESKSTKVFEEFLPVLLSCPELPLGFQLSLCHCSLEAKNDVINSIIGQDFSSKGFNGYSLTAHDCYAVVQAINSIPGCGNLVINFSNCGSLGHVRMLQDVLAKKKGDLQVVELDFSYNSLTDNCISELFLQAAIAFRQLEKINLGGNLIQTKGVQSLVSALSKYSSSSLTEMDLSNNCLSACAMEYLTDAICTNKLSRLGILSLRGSLPSSKDHNGLLLDGMMQGLYNHCSQLSVLDLSENNIGTSGALAVGKNLENHQRFSLQLNKANLSDDGLCTLIKAIKSNCQLDVLELENNNISSVGTCCLADAVSSSRISISELNLANNPLGHEGCQAICRMLKNEHCNVSSIILSGCSLIIQSSVSRITAEQATIDIGQALFQVPQGCAISYLNLDKNNFTRASMNILCGLISFCPSLQDLSCNTCSINGKDIRYLIDKLKEVKKVKSDVFTSMKSWDLGNNEINDSGVSSLLDCLPSLLPSIHHGKINLHNNPVGDAMFKKFQEVVRGDKASYLSASRHFKVNTEASERRLLFVGSNASVSNELTDSEISLLNVYNCKAKCCSQVEEVTYSINYCSSHIILVEGYSGCGKSTLAQHLVSHKKFTSFQIVIYFQQDKKVYQRIHDMIEVAMELQIEQSELMIDIENAGANVLFVLDGFDEVARSKNWKTNIYGKILLKRIFPLSSVLVLSRPFGVSCLKDVLKIDQHFQLQGLPINDPKNTLSPLCFKEHWITVMCNQHPSLLKLCESPLIAQLVCKYLKEEREKVTLTDIMIFVITELIKREMTQQGKEYDSELQLLDLPASIFDDFEKICKLAFESILNSNILTTSDEINRFISSFNLNNMSAIDESLTFGLVEILCDPEISRIEFLHPLICEFLAGYYLSLQPPLDQLSLIYQYISRQVSGRHATISYLLLFFFGIAWRKKSELNLNPTKLMITTLVEFPASCLELENADKSDYNLTLMLCVEETKDDELWKKLATKLGGDLSFQLTSDDIRKYKWTIATMVSSSQVKEWNIHASNFRISEELELFMAVRVNKLEVPSMGRSVIKLSPKVSIEAASKKLREVEKFDQYPDKELALMNYFQCRAIREILQRALTMFTESIRLKGDASNPSYVSFLNCKCFQKNVENNLKFDPSLPFHFLEVTSKKTLQKLQQEHGEHLASEHDGKATELVILLKPCLRRITIQYKSSVHYIVIMSEELAQNSLGKGAVASMVADLNEAFTGNFTACTEEHISSIRSVMVRPSLPLPPKIEENLRATAVLPPAVSSNISHLPMIHPNMHGESEQCHEKQNSVRESSRNDTEKAGALSSTSHHSFNYNFQSSLHHPRQQLPHTTTTTATAATQQTKSHIKPGTLLYTSDPRQFPADVVHSLPDESHQLRRGGNGQIFKGTIGGMDVIYKKTNYRSKEYAIITKVKHKNIVKLIAFMYGAENPAYKRRNFCYHILPEMSGDCARMLTDKEHLTIRELNKKYEGNIRKMGIIRGNLKYLLKQILEGLRYLHSLHIAHRDIKGSNVLLRFFCSCTNPLECGCDTKYQVQICDYDAAVELQYVDKTENLPPTSFGSRSSSQQSQVYYISVPVGTNGFRSPECSMLTVSNHPNSFSPPVITRCDIWSLGILTSRILIGVNGPHTQREMALLLLHYYRQRYMPEGLHRYGYVEVDRLVTDKLLHLPQLVKKIGWLRGAVRFIECCVAIDPLARHSAEALLQHDFLY